MRKTLFASAALLGLAVAAPAFSPAIFAQGTGGNQGPIGTPPEHYLDGARQAIQEHHRNHAIAELNRAEADLLDKEAPPTRGHQSDDSPGIREIGRAREAVREGKWGQADTYVTEAARHPGAGGGLSAGVTNGGATVGTKP